MLNFSVFIATRLGLSDHRELSRRWFWCLTLNAGLFIGCIASAPADNVVFEGYEKFYLSLPNRVFREEDKKTLSDTDLSVETNISQWAGRVEGDRRSHSVKFRGADVTVDGRRFPSSRAIVFPGEKPTDLFDGAKLFVAKDCLCVEGHARSANGTADRLVFVSLIIKPFDKYGATRYELPSLFSSCLGLRRDRQGLLHFFRVTLNPPKSNPYEALGNIFNDYVIENGKFRRSGTVLQGKFNDPENVFRFTVPESISKTR